jgi:peroxiredoxin
MAQLRLDYNKFLERNAEVVVVGPDSAEDFKQYWQEHDLPFVGLPDPRHKVLKLYGQEIKILKFGRMPAQALIDIDGIVREIHYGRSMSDIPTNEEWLSLLDNLNHDDDSIIEIE